MPRYKSRRPPSESPQALADFLGQELLQIDQAIQALYDGVLESTRAFPARNNNVLRFGDEDFDLGDGAGLYLRIGTQWYKLNMYAVAPGQFPQTGRAHAVGQTPAVTVV